MSFLKTFLCSACAGLTILFTNVTLAQSYPEKPIRIVVPSTAGGSVDTLSRVIGSEISKRLGQPVVIVNRPGAGGAIAADSVAQSAPDGYTLIMGTVASFATNVSLQKLRYDPVKDFAPVSLVATQDLILVVSPSVPVNSVKELVVLAKKNPGKFTFASAGIGTGGHLSGELFKILANIDLLHVPYKGVAPLMVDVISNQVTMTFGSTMSALTQVKTGKLRALAITSEKRSDIAPDIPTMAQAGVPGYSSQTWYGLLAPAGTPPEIVEKLSVTVAKILRSPDVKTQLLGEGFEVVGSSPQQFLTFIKSEIAKWAKVIKTAGLQAK